MLISEVGPAPLSVEFSIVSGANEELLVACLDSLLATLPPAYRSARITVICNRPGSDLPARLVARHPRLRIVENVAPRGFAANHNAVLADAEADVVWVLNDDLVLLPGTVAHVMEFLGAPGNERVAVVSPRLLNPDRTLQPSTYRFPTAPRLLLAYSGLRGRPWLERLLPRVARLLRREPGASRFWAHDRTIAVDTLRGACVAVRMAAAAEVGLMTEVALVGGEETEWHRRFAAAGWRVVFFPEADVIHYGSQSVGTDGRYEAEYVKSTLYYFRRWRSGPTYHGFRIAAAALFAIRWTAARLRRDATGTARLRAAWRICLRPGSAPPIGYPRYRPL